MVECFDSTEYLQPKHSLYMEDMSAGKRKQMKARNKQLGKRAEGAAIQVKIPRLLHVPQLWHNKYQ